MDLVCRLTPRRCCSSSILRPRCSRDGKDDEGSRRATDWDKAWVSFKKSTRKSLFSQFDMNKYVTWNPRRSDYPLAEEVDPIKKTERFNLRLWTSPQFTLFGAIIIVSFLLLYTVLSPPPK
ncbi:2,3-bisphosphoglycerate-independent phosphoglycerate mutase [Wolffia australiana]